MAYPNLSTTSRARLPLTGAFARQTQDNGLQIALTQRAAGRSVIPVRRAQHKDQRIPLLKWTPYQTKLPTEAEVRQWWRQWPNANPVIVTGAVSNLIALDVDSAEGLAWLTGLGLPDTFTASRGNPERCHFWLQHPGFKVANRTLHEGVEVKGDGGTIPAPGAIHWSGAPYRVIADLPIAPAPDWLIDLLRPKVYERPAPRPVSAPADVVQAYGQAGLTEECARVTSAAASDANNQLFRSSAAIGSLIAAGALDESTAYAALLDAARQRGKLEGEARATILSGFKHGKAQPRDLSHLEQDRSQLRAADSAADSLSRSLSGECQPWPASWPNGVPDVVRAALARYDHPAIAPTLELWHEATRAGLADEGEGLTLADLNDLAQSTGRGVTSDTIRHAVKLGADYFAVVCPPSITSQEGVKECLPGQTTAKAADSQISPHRPAVYRRVVSPAGFYPAFLKRAWRRIVEKHFPVEGDDLTLAPIRDLFADAPGTAAALDEKYGALVEAQPDLKDKLDAARAEYEHLAASLHDGHSTRLPSGWKFRNAAEHAACFARAIVESRGGETQLGKPTWADVLGKSERRIKTIFTRAGIDDLTDQTEEKPIRSAGDLPRNPGWFDKRLLSYEPGRAEPVARFRDLKDADSTARFVAAETARGHIVKLERQVANKQRIASAVQPEPRPRVVRQSAQPDEANVSTPDQPVQARHTPQRATPTVKRPPRRAYFGPGPDPAWRDRGILRLLDLAGLPSGQIDPATGEIAAYTPAQALDVLLGKPVTTWIERSDPERDEGEQPGPTDTGDPILDYCVNELGGTVHSSTPTIEHPGQALWEQYQSFTNLNKRDDWYQELDPVDRDALIHYKYRVLRGGKAA